jgi:hypothetical protein
LWNGAGCKGCRQLSEFSAMLFLIAVFMGPFVLSLIFGVYLLKSRWRIVGYLSIAASLLALAVVFMLYCQMPFANKCEWLWWHL